MSAGKTMTRTPEQFEIDQTWEWLGEWRPDVCTSAHPAYREALTEIMACNDGTAWEISNVVSGCSLGVYRAESPEEALAEMYRDAGYADAGDAPGDGGDLIVECVSREGGEA
jgi:hypothetical protein